MKAPNKKKTEEQIARRRDAGLRALLKMPPKPHDQITGKKKPKPKGQRTRSGNLK